MKSVQICGDNRSTDNNACFIKKIYEATLIMFLHLLILFQLTSYLPANKKDRLSDLFYIGFVPGTGIEPAHP